MTRTGSVLALFLRRSGETLLPPVAGPEFLPGLASARRSMERLSEITIPQQSEKTSERIMSGLAGLGVLFFFIGRASTAASYPRRMARPNLGRHYAVGSRSKPYTISESAKLLGFGRERFMSERLTCHLGSQLDSHLID